MQPPEALAVVLGCVMSPIGDTVTKFFPNWRTRLRLIVGKAQKVHNVEEGEASPCSPLALYVLICRIHETHGVYNSDRRCRT